MRFGKREAQSTIYRPISDFEGVGKVDCELDFTNEFAVIHPVFDVPMIKKCTCQRFDIHSFRKVWELRRIFLMNQSGGILNRLVKSLRNKEIASVKVLQRNLLVECATWEAEVDMVSIYPHLFPSTPILH